MGRRVALFGGSFDPPHCGHVLAVAQVLSVARVEHLRVVPCFRHFFDKPLAPFEQRLEMTRLAMAPFGGQVEVSDIERSLGGVSRTLVTVDALRSRHPDEQVVLVIGADLVAERERWYGYAELATKVEQLIIGRAAHSLGTVDDGPGMAITIPNVSSSEVRARVAAGLPIEGLVPARVADYIAAHALYRAAPVDGEGGAPSTSGS